MYAGANSPSYRQAAESLRALAELDVPVKQVQRVTQRVGEERVAERDAAVKAHASLPLTERKGSPPRPPVPGVAAALVDGARLQIRDAAEEESEEEARPPWRSGKHWREDRIGLLLAMSSEEQATDPCPEVPPPFVGPTRILRLARELKPVPAGEEAAAEAARVEEGAAAAGVAEEKAYLPPEVVQWRVVATRRSWRELGPQVAAAARAMGLLGASRRAFVGDGAEVSWALWRRHFSSFEPILGFIHALSYVFAAAQAGRKFAEGWPVYARWITWVWQGQVAQVIAELAGRQLELGAPKAGEAETSPRQVVARALTYLRSHKDKMRYNEYRRKGLPLTSSLWNQ